MCCYYIFFSLSIILSVLAERRWKVKKSLNIVNAEDTTEQLESSQQSYEVL